MKEIILVAAIVLSFALFVTAHLAIVWGLLFRAPRWRSPVALVLPPLAPYWAVRERMRVRAILWIASLVVYALARIVSGS